MMCGAVFFLEHESNSALNEQLNFHMYQNCIFLRWSIPSGDEKWHQALAFVTFLDRNCPTRTVILLCTQSWPLVDARDAPFLLSVHLYCHMAATSGSSKRALFETLVDNDATEGPKNKVLRLSRDEVEDNGNFEQNSIGTRLLLFVSLVVALLQSLFVAVMMGARLAFMMNMPRDVFCIVCPLTSRDLSVKVSSVSLQVAAYPLDLLHMARASKVLRALLFSPESRSIWRASRKGHLSEPMYASLVFERACHVSCAQTLISYS